MRAFLQISFLTALFGGGYYAMRTIPATNCSFLHYQQMQVTSDGLQYCCSGATYFVDLDQLPFPVTLTLTPDTPPQQGVESHYTLRITDNGGNTFTPSQLAITQTRKLHLLLVDQNLEDYQHIHPEPVGETGDWTFSFTPRTGGTYRAYAQFMPSLTMSEMIAEAKLPVKGEDEPSVIRGMAPFKQDGYIYKLVSSVNPVTAGVRTQLTLSVQRADGGNVVLQPVMDTLAHLVAFDPTRDGVAHLHPTQTGNEKNPTDPQLSFLINFLKPGRFRVWGQVKIDGQERYVPFDVDVQG